MAFASVALLSVVTPAYIRLASSARVVPFVVYADSAGTLTPGGPVRPLTELNEQLISAQLGAFVRNVRTVLPAAAALAQADMMRRGYAVVDASSAAATFLNSCFADQRNDPRVVGQTLHRQAQRVTARPAPGTEQTTWFLHWSENDVPLQAGVPPRTAEWEDDVTIRVAPPTTDRAVVDNPLGLFATSLNWQLLNESERTQ